MHLLLDKLNFLCSPVHSFATVGVRCESRLISPDHPFPSIWAFSRRSSGTELQVYVLLLQERKIYVGYSDRAIGERFIDHFNFNGSKWTSKYRPLQVLHVEQGGIEKENEITLKMMEKYGWWNVRGGSWCNVEMNSCPPALLHRQQSRMPIPLRKNEIESDSVFQINHGENAACYRCGRTSHFISNCFAKTDVIGQILQSSGFKEDSGSESDLVIDLSNAACYRCGRTSHFISNCFAKTDVHGQTLRSTGLSEDSGSESESD